MKMRRPTDEHQVAQIVTFVEARLGRNEAGKVVSEHRDITGTSWASELIEHPGLRLAARVDRPGTSDGRELVGSVIPLPYYVGLRQLARRMPSLLRAIVAAVDSADVICVKLPGVIGTLAVFTAVVKRRPIAVQVVGDIGDVLDSGVGGLPGRIGSPIVRWVTKWSVSQGQAVRYVTKNTLQRRYPPAAGAQVIGYSDVEIASVVCERDASKVIRGRVVTVGSQEQMYKGQHVLIRALEKLKPTHPWISVDVIGEGRFQGELRRLAKSAGVEDQVRFVGQVATWSDLKVHLDRAELFVLPSLTEGLPRALVEAMSRGLPCIASDVGGIPELLPADAMCTPGNEVALAECIREMLDNPVLMRRHGVNNARKAKEFSVEQRESGRAQWSAIVGKLNSLSSRRVS